MSDQNFATSIQLILQASVAGTPRHEVLLEICQTPQYLVDHGFPELPLCVLGKVIDKAFFDHGITKGVLERLGDIVNNPKALYRSATQPDAGVVVTFEMKAGCPILVPIHKNVQVGRTAVVNRVASLYAKEATVEARWASQGLLLWQR